MSSVFEALENSIIESGGACERLQTDNAKCFVINASKDNLVWNARYLAFCGHYGFKNTRSLPRHPWSKGKVERPFDYLEEQFIKGNNFDSFGDFISRLKNFQDKVNNRAHATTKEKPALLFEKERFLLSGLPATRYVSIKEEARKAKADCLVSYGGNRYSVPYLFAAKEVMFIELFPNCSWLPDKLKTQKRINPNYHLTRIIDMAKYYQQKDMEKAFEISKEYNLYNALFIKNYLEQNAAPFEIEPLRINSLTKNNYEKTDIKRALDYYKIKGL